MKNIVLTSCGIIDEDFKNEFYNIVSREELSNKKVLYITTAADGDVDDDKSWMDDEYKSILDLGINEDNITEYKIGVGDINLNCFDIIYMMGGNTFYLLDMIRKYKFDILIKKFIESKKIYIGSSAGSEILGNSIEIALPYDDNIVNMRDFTGLRIVDGLIVPHCNRKKEFIKKLSKERDNIIQLFDGSGFIV